MTMRSTLDLAPPLDHHTLSLSLSRPKKQEGKNESQNLNDYSFVLAEASLKHEDADTHDRLHDSISSEGTGGITHASEQPT